MTDQSALPIDTPTTADLSAQIEVLTAQGDQDKITIAKLTAALADQGAPLPVIDPVGIVRPKFGEMLDIPHENLFARAGTVEAIFKNGDVMQFTFADDDGAIQPFPVIIGGADTFAFMGGAFPHVRLIQPLDIDALSPACVIRYAILLTMDGKILSACRFSALLFGGGGNTAFLAGNSVQFNLNADRVSTNKKG